MCVRIVPKIGCGYEPLRENPKPKKKSGGSKSKPPEEPKPLSEVAFLTAKRTDDAGIVWLDEPEPAIVVNDKGGTLPTGDSHRRIRRLKCRTIQRSHDSGRTPSG